MSFFVFDLPSAKDHGDISQFYVRERFNNSGSPIILMNIYL